MGVYNDKWNEFRRLNRGAIIFLFLGLFGILIIFLIYGVVTQSDPINLYFAAMILWGLIFIRLAFRVVRFPCPRCDTPFLFRQDPGGRQCSKCGLALYEDPS
jgi:hypothetical protein